MNIKEFIARIKETHRRRESLEKQLQAESDAILYYNIDFENDGTAYITFKSERITTDGDSQTEMLSRLRTLRQMYIDNRMSS